MFIYLLYIFGYVCYILLYKMNFFWYDISVILKNERMLYFMNIGIDKISFYVFKYYVDMVKFVEVC